MILDALKRWMGSGGEDDDDGNAEMLSCEDALTRIYEFLDGELEKLTHEQVERHFKVCKRCYPQLQWEKSFRRALHRVVDEEEAPEELKAKVRRLLEAEAGGVS